MVRHDLKLIDEDSLLRCCFSDGSSHKVFILELPHHVITVLCCPDKVPVVESDFVA